MGSGEGTYMSTSPLPIFYVQFPALISNRSLWSKRRSSPPFPTLLLGQQHLGDSLLLHIRCAFVYLADLAIAEEFLHRIIFHVAVAAVQIHGQRRHFFGDFRSEEFGHRRLFDERQFGVLQPR